METKRISELLEVFVKEDAKELKAVVSMWGKSHTVTISRPNNISNVIEIEIIEE